MTALTHGIEWTINDGLISGVVTCHAEQGAPCRMRCPNDCEEWNADHECGLVDGDCLALGWLLAAGIRECHLRGGEDQPLRTGPIEVWYEDGWVWCYPATSAEVAS